MISISTNNSQNCYLSPGLLHSNSDAGIATVGMNIKHYTIGFSYDVTFSALKTAVNSKGAFELAFIYRAKSTRLVKKIIPCERY